MNAYRIFAMGNHYAAAPSPLLLPPAVGDNAAMETEPLKADSPKRKRRWFQFSMRTLLIFTLVCAVASALVARRVAEKRKDREVVAEVFKSGGIAYYDYQREGTDRTPPGPDWIRRLAGENVFSDVFLLSWIGKKSNAVDAGLASCERFVKVE